jgi:hypothetical protein
MAQRIERKHSLLRRAHSDKHVAKQTASRALRTNELFEQIMMVVSGPDPVPRVKQIFSQCMRNHRSKSHLCQQIVKASQGLYKPRGFNEVHSKKEVVFRKLIKAAAGPRLLRACRDMGMLRISPPVDPKSGKPAKPHGRFRTCLAALDAPTLANNLASMAPLETWPETTYTILMIDEFACEERARHRLWDNGILGFCAEHSGPFPLHFTGMGVVDDLADGLKSRALHYASEVENFALGPMRPTRYHCIPIASVPTCKKQRSPLSQIQSYDTIVEQWYPSGVEVGPRGRLLQLAADGDHIRRMSARQWCGHELAGNSPLHAKLPKTKLLDKLVGPHDITFTVDQKHSLVKRTRTHDKSRASYVARAVGEHMITVHHIRTLFEASKLDWHRLMSPDGEQNVTQAMGFLEAMASLADVDVVAIGLPSYKPLELAIQVLGMQHQWILDAYFNHSLSNRESAVAIAKLQAIFAKFPAIRQQILPCCLLPRHPIHFSINNLQLCKVPSALPIGILVPLDGGQ